MAEDNEILPTGNLADAQSSDVSTLDALHIEGKSAERLDDAEEHELPESTATEREDVKGLANVQSANRNTFEAMRDGAPAEQGAAPTGGQVVVDPYTPGTPDNAVAARFENPFPQFTPVIDTEAEAQAPTREQPVFDLPREVPQDRIEGGPIGGPDPAAASQPVAVAPPEQPEFIPEQPVVEQPEPPELIPTIAQTPTVIAGAASGTEDQLTKLEISASLNDIDHGGERLSLLTISGIPDGFDIVDHNGNPIGTLSGGVWTLSDVTPLTLADIYLRNLDSDDDADFSGDFTLSVTVTSSEPGSTATTTVALPVHIEAVADTPVLAVHDVAGMENDWINLYQDDGHGGHTPYIVVTSKDQDGSETQSVALSGLPTGTSLRYSDETGQHTITSTGVGSAYVIPASALGTLQLRSAGNDSLDFDIEVRASSTEAMNGDTATSAPQTFHVDMGVLAPSVSGSGSGVEDGFADLTLSATVNAKLGDEQIKVYIEGLPDGVILKTAGGVTLGTVTYIGADGQTHTGYDVTAYRQADGSITGLQVGWDTDHAATTHLDTDIDFKLRAVVSDVEGQNGSTDTLQSRPNAPDVNETVSDVHVTIKAVADAPTVSGTAIGVEDQWFDLKIDADRKSVV